MIIESKERDKVIKDIQWLFSKLSMRDQKYLRNVNRFLSNGKRKEGIRNIYTTPVAFFNAVVDEKTGALPAINVGRSIALTLQSKLIQTKGRIFFDTVNGLWKTIKVTRNAQIYFDAMVERDNLADKVKRAVLDALIFEFGVIWTDEESKSNIRIKPWEFYVDPAEYNYDKVSRCMVQHDDYPMSAIVDKLEKDSPLYRQYENDPNTKITLYRYWDLRAKKKYLVANTEVIEVVDIEYEKMPFSLFFYNDPIKGLFSTSVMDNTNPNQKQIDSLLRRIHDAYELSPGNTIYIPNTAGNEHISKMISNKVGNIIPYNPAAGGVVVSTPPPIDPSYMSTLEYFIKSTFEQEGVSQLSAQSKKPTGINSSVGLDTLQDIESERFQVVVDNLIQFYKDIYSNMIDVFPADDEILPSRLNRANIKWGDIKKNRDAFSMTSSLASMLSKDTKVKMEQLDKLQQQNVINPNQYAQLLEIPDLNGAYSVATASYDNCMKIVERAIDNDRYDFYSVVNLTQLLDCSVNTLLQLDSNDEDPKVLARLVKLIEVVMAKFNDKNNAQTPPPMPPPIPITPPQKVQDATLNGMQITAIAEIVEKVIAGTMALTSAQALLAIAFPMIDPNTVNAMLTGQTIAPDEVPVQPQPSVLTGLMK